MALKHKLLEGERLRLRAPEPADIPAMTAMENETEWWEAGSPVGPVSEAAVSEFVATYSADLLSTRQMRLVGVTASDSEPAVIIDLFDYDPLQRRAQVGVITRADCRGHGFAREGLDILARYATVHLGLEMLWAIVADDNVASCALFSRAGYTRSAKLRGWLRRPGGRQDASLFQLYPLPDC